MYIPCDLCVYACLQDWNLPVEEQDQPLPRRAKYVTNGLLSTRCVHMDPDQLFTLQLVGSRRCRCLQLANCDHASLRAALVHLLCPVNKSFSGQLPRAGKCFTVI